MLNVFLLMSLLCGYGRWALHVWPAVRWAFNRVLKDHTPFLHDLRVAYRNESIVCRVLHIYCVLDVTLKITALFYNIL